MNEVTRSQETSRGDESKQTETTDLFKTIQDQLKSVIDSTGDVFQKLSEIVRDFQKVKDFRQGENTDDRLETDFTKTFLGSIDSLKDRQLIQKINSYILAAFKTTDRLDDIPMDDTTPHDSLLRILKKDSTELLSDTNLMGILHVATEKDDLNVRDEKGRRISELKKGDRICLTIDPNKKPKVIRAKPSNKDNLFVHVEKPDGTAIGYICAKYVQTNSTTAHYKETMSQAQLAEQQKAELPRLKEQILSEKRNFSKLHADLSNEIKQSTSYKELIGIEPLKSYLTDRKQSNIEDIINVKFGDLDKISDIQNIHKRMSEEKTRFTNIRNQIENYHILIKSAEQTKEMFIYRRDRSIRSIRMIRLKLSGTINPDKISDQTNLEKYLTSLNHKDNSNIKTSSLNDLENNFATSKLVYSLGIFFQSYFSKVDNLNSKSNIKEKFNELLTKNNPEEIYPILNTLRKIQIQNTQLNPDNANKTTTTDVEAYHHPKFKPTTRQTAPATEAPQAPQAPQGPEAPQTPQTPPAPTPDQDTPPAPRRETADGKLTPAENFRFSGTTLTERISQFEQEINSKRVAAPQALKPEFTSFKLLPSTFELIQKTLLEQIRKPDQKIAFIQDNKIITALNDASTSSLVITLNLNNTSAQEELEFQNSLRKFLIANNAKQLSPAPQLKEAITYSENLNTIKQAFQGTNFTQEEISQIINFEKLQQVSPNKRELEQDLENIKLYISGKLTTITIKPLNCFDSSKINQLRNANESIQKKSIDLHLNIFQNFGKKYNLYNSENGNYEGSFIEGGQSFTEDSYIKSTNEASPSKRREYFDKFKQFAEKLRGQNDKYSESLKSLHFLSKMPPKSTAETYKQTFKEIETNKASLGANAQILMHELVKNYFKSHATITEENIGTIEITSTFQDMKPIYKTMFYLKSGLRDKVTSTDDISRSMVEVYDALQGDISLLQNPSSNPLQIIRFLQGKFELNTLNIKNLYNLQKTLNISNPNLSKLLIGLNNLGGTPEQKVDFIEKLYPTAEIGRKNRIRLEGEFKIELTDTNNVNSTKEFKFPDFRIISESEITYDGSTYILKNIVSGNKQWQKQT